MTGFGPRIAERRLARDENAAAEAVRLNRQPMKPSPSGPTTKLGAKSAADTLVSAMLCDVLIEIALAGASRTPGAEIRSSA